MSNKILNLVRDARLGTENATKKEVLKVIADQSNDAGRGVWSSYAYIAWCLERDRSTVIRACQWLGEQGLLSSEKRQGTTNLWTINIDALSAIGTPYRDKIEQEDEGLQETTSADEGSQETTPLVAGDHPPSGDTPPKPLLNPKEPTLSVEETTYIDDVDGVPDELMMEWDTFLRGWAHYFPTKRQPRSTNATLMRKFKTRMKSTEWRANWKQAVKMASQWQWAQDEGWFKAEWILHNNDNIYKILDGTFDFKNKPLTGQTYSVTIVDGVAPNPRNARVNLKQRPDETDEEYQRRING